MSYYTFQGKLGRDGDAHYTFQIIPTSIKKRGWAKCQLIHISRRQNSNSKWEHTLCFDDSPDGIVYINNMRTCRVTSVENQIKIYWTGGLLYAIRNTEFTPST